ncbi:sugar transferase [Microbacterium trichothecenolyticum]|uniref:Exopolysaccharide biosynthesis polyprenyl glycosylphosphotransferase n=1 Tax=Microbacterium trichothecenolyticum TaxID=69370 RepID=A0ABU0TUA4_MICTR|nr:sugar transferase [Microbacterium trichothecenolyticum]MDQ1123248.1 exopolysaccharide biosynthesis polyprenyl glycosylphosphotransferase [Microbacterium trichothecenolyticum]
MNTATSLMESPHPSTRITPRETARRPPWQRRYARLVACVDVLVVIAAVAGTQLFWLGPHPVDVASAPLDYSTVSVGVCTAWLLALALWGTRQPRVVGYGVSEYRLVLTASTQVFGIVAIVAYLTSTELSRGYFLLSLPVGSVALIIGRLLCRRWLAAKRRSGSMGTRVVLVGGPEENARVATELARQPGAGLRVVGVHTLSRTASESMWNENQANLLTARLRELDADSVLVSGGTLLDARDIRRIGWSLDPGRQHLIVAVNLTDVAGPRLHTRPVAGLPLVHIETPQYSARQRVMKRAFDIVGAGSLVLLLSPVFLVLAALVRASGPGPILYRQERVGQGGVPFGMLKFRSMVDGADARLQDLLAAQGRNDTPLFKVENDPRITPVGRVLRKYSLDELPQLLNVLAGQMSLVGPRPQRDAEVEFYDDDAHRRLIVRPGMSGLWQVSGRSALAWEDAIRLDLFYVENWSLIGDLVILARTFKAVVAPGSTAH